MADDGGHKWPGTAGTSILNGDSATQDFFATEVAWNFLRQFSKNCNSISVADQILLKDNLFPNPTTGILYSNHLGTTLINAWRVYNKMGQNVLNGQHFPVDLSKLSSGYYTLFLEIDGKIETHYVLKF